jgi:redox-sensitive bicupin YhaK (pirin superfamily)
MAPGAGAVRHPIVDVEPHPHIGLATVTYLFEGTLLHRDSLGTIQRIEPAAVNWMTAGAGIVHSERTPDELRANPLPLLGVQCWVALPEETEQGSPHFEHYPSKDRPFLEAEGATARLIAGSMSGKTSPVKTDSRLLCVGIDVPHRASWSLEVSEEERAVVVVSGRLRVAGTWIEEGSMALLSLGPELDLLAEAKCRALLIGGPALAKRRVMDWNFVATDRALIERAKEKYRLRELGVIPGETDQLPLPEDVR